MVYRIVFDLDDTLLKSGHCYNQQLEEFAEFVQSEFPEAGIKEQILEKYDEFDRQAIRKNGFRKEHFPEAMVTTWKFYCSEYGREVRPAALKECLMIGWHVYDMMPEPVPSMSKVLNELAREFELILYTMGDVEIQQTKIEHYDLRDWFNEIHIVSRKTLSTLKNILKPDFSAETAIVGDSLRGEIKPAVELGLSPIHVESDFPWSYHEVSVSENFPRINSLPEIFDYL